MSFHSTWLFLGKRKYIPWGKCFGRMTHWSYSSWSYSSYVSIVTNHCYDSLNWGCMVRKKSRFLSLSLIYSCILNFSPCQGLKHTPETMLTSHPTQIMHWLLRIPIQCLFVFAPFLGGGWRSTLNHRLISLLFSNVTCLSPHPCPNCVKNTLNEAWVITNFKSQKKSYGFFSDWTLLPQLALNTYCSLKKILVLCLQWPTLSCHSISAT
jgi:hypothetical protein